MGKFDTPVNRTAANVIAKGVHYESNIDKLRNLDNPLIIYKELPKSIKNQKSFEDFTGRKIGNFTVIGLVRRRANEHCKKAEGKWLVKCSCGQYEKRTTKYLKTFNNYENNNYMCLACNDLRILKLKDKAIQRGMTYEEYCEKYFPRTRNKI